MAEMETASDEETYADIVGGAVDRNAECQAAVIRREYEQACSPGGSDHLFAAVYRAWRALRGAEPPCVCLVAREVLEEGYTDEKLKELLSNRAMCWMHASSVRATVGVMREAVLALGTPAPQVARLMSVMMRSRTAWPSCVDGLVNPENFGEIVAELVDWGSNGLVCLLGLLDSQDPVVARLAATARVDVAYRLIAERESGDYWIWKDSHLGRRALRFFRRFDFVRAASMGMHPRLGVDSPLQVANGDVLLMIAHYL